MGIHTGESIVVAPSQTLDDQEYQLLRTHRDHARSGTSGIVGECNIQYALDPRQLATTASSRSMRACRARARWRARPPATRSPTSPPRSALGYVAARDPERHHAADDRVLRAGARLHRLQGAALGPRPSSRARRCSIGSEMKSVGEVMAIGRTFPEVIAEGAAHARHRRATGSIRTRFEFDDLRCELANATPLRIFAVAQALRDGMSVDEIHAAHAHRPLVPASDRSQSSRCTSELAKRAGALLDADDAARSQSSWASPISAIERLTRPPEAGATRRSAIARHPPAPRADRHHWPRSFPRRPTTSIRPTTRRAATSRPSLAQEIMVLGSGAYRIGSSVEFDWCCVNAVQARRDARLRDASCSTTTPRRSAPTTTSATGWSSTRSASNGARALRARAARGRGREHGRADPEQPGACGCTAHGVPMLGTSAGEHRSRRGPQQVQRAARRARDRPAAMGARHRRRRGRRRSCERLGGFPVLVRPSYVLSGAAMSVAHEPNELERILARAQATCRPSTRSWSRSSRRTRARSRSTRWPTTARSCSGRSASTSRTPASTAATRRSCCRRRRSTSRRSAGSGEIAAELARALDDHRAVQRAVPRQAQRGQGDRVQPARVAQLPVRLEGDSASTSPAEAMRRMLGRRRRLSESTASISTTSASRCRCSRSRGCIGADPMLGVEMASTGEVGCIGDDLHDALLHGLLATGFRFPQARRAAVARADCGQVLVRRRGEGDRRGTQAANLCHAGHGENAARDRHRLHCGREAGRGQVNAIDLIDQGEVDLVINVPREYDAFGRPDGVLIRRAAVDAGVPLITDLQLARAVVEALRRRKPSDLQVLAWQDYVRRDPKVLLRAHD